MKKIIFFFGLLFPILALGQSQDQNYIISVAYKTASVTPLTDPDPAEANVTVNYFDGLGRPVQQVAYKQSGVSSKSIITPIGYDEFGRQSKEYLPYIGNANKDYDTGAMGSTLTFYGSANPIDTGNPYFESTGNPFSEKFFESSPLNRVLKQAAPGNDWAMNEGHEIKYDYLANGKDEVRSFKVSLTFANNLYTPTLVLDGFYGIGRLYKTITKDENWVSGNLHTTEEFKDKEGKIVLKRTYNDDGQYDTYYVYDVYGNLTFVLPPMVVLNNPIANQLDGLCYQYRYDHRNRLAEKKLPGKDWEFIVYDQLDRPVISGPVLNPFDGSTVGWLFNKYDAFGRICFTGWFNSTASRASLQGSYNGTVSNAERGSSSIDGIMIGYAQGIYPLGLELLTVNYYDDYNYTPDQPQNIPTVVYDAQPLIAPKGLLTGSWVRALTTENESAAEKTYILYDYNSKAIYTHKTNYLGGFTEIETDYNFIGQPLLVHTQHRRTANATAIQTLEEFQYTAQGRLLNDMHTINSGQVELIAKNGYDELGALINKGVGSDIQMIDYQYNIRGWLTQINDVKDIGNDLFAFKINYNTVDDAIYSEPLFNGNISETFWQTSSDNLKRQYSYGYDALNRMTSALYQKPSAIGNYDEYLSYDKGGNILSLDRTGNLDTPTMNNSIDVLTYSYDTANPNRLMVVTDSTNDPNGFKDGINTGNDFDYDNFGNLKYDYNKGIAEITYSHMNLPIQITLGTIGKISYVYDATGKKLRKKVEDGVTNITTTTDYLDGFQYKNNKLQFFPTTEGYVNYTKNENTTEEGYFNYVYNYLDHLGNIRLSYSKDPSDGIVKILEENHYYPFGLKHTNYSSDKKKYVEENEVLKIKAVPQFGKTEYNYKYNGKELQDELGLNWYDYQARNYDPAIGRWMNIDPLAEKMRRWSPYNYCFDNPMRFVDPDGMGPNDIIIVGTAAFKQQAFNDLQKLSNDKLVMMPDGQVKVNPSTSTANSSKSLPVGTNMVAGLIASDKVVTIKETTGGNQTSRSSNDSDITPTGNGKGTDSTVEYNPTNAGTGVVNTDGTTGRPPEIGLGHELAHAEHNKNGTRDPAIDTTKTDPDSGRTGVLSNNEVSVRKTDSAIRKEQGVIERMQP